MLLSFWLLSLSRGRNRKRLEQRQSPRAASASRSLGDGGSANGAARRCTGSASLSPAVSCRRSASLRMGAFALKPTVTLDADVGAAYEKTKIGVLLLNLGGPDDLDAVEPFLCANPPDSAVHDAPLHAHWAPHNALEAPPPG